MTERNVPHETPIRVGQPYRFPRISGDWEQLRKRKWHQMVWQWIIYYLGTFLAQWDSQRVARGRHSHRLDKTGLNIIECFKRQVTSPCRRNCEANRCRQFMAHTGQFQNPFQAIKIPYQQHAEAMYQSLNWESLASVLLYYEQGAKREAKFFLK